MGDSHNDINLKQKFQNMFRKNQLENIEFVRPTKEDTYVDELRLKYQGKNQNLFTEKDNYKELLNQTPTSYKTCNNMKDSVDSPCLLISDPKLIVNEWTKHRITRIGFTNVGNTCFLNSILQILTFTAPFWNYITDGTHKQECNYQGFCALCGFESLFTAINNCQSSSIVPRQIISNIKSIRKNFVIGKQQDAHEFFLALIDNMQTTIINGRNKLDRFSKATTSIDHIFGGWTETTVQCQNCKYCSTTFSPMIDISLKLNQANDIEAALHNFTRSQLLNESTNRYKCEKCMKKVSASLKTALYKLPNILTIQLSRFSVHHGSISKFCKSIKFNEQLNMRPFLANNSSDHDCSMYNLYGVVVHRGQSCNCGHYYSYVKDSNDIWYMANDSHVQKVSWDRVVSDQPYILFYRKIKCSIPTSNSNSLLNNLVIHDGSTRNSFLATNFKNKDVWTEALSNIDHLPSESTNKSNPNVLTTSKDIEKTVDDKSSPPLIVKWDQKVQVDRSKLHESTNDTVEQLEQNMARKVVQWDGNISSLNVSSNIEKDLINRNLKKRNINPDDEEYDRGKLKKVRLTKLYHDNRLFRRNAFQSFYNRMVVSKHTKVKRLKTS